jgi:hypothetical protein
MLGTLKHKLEEKAKYLSDVQPHDDEWDSECEEAQYFTLQLIIEALEEMIEEDI